MLVYSHQGLATTTEGDRGMTLMSDEEIWTVLEKHWEETEGDKDFGDAYSLEDAQAIAKAQAKKVLFEMELYCDHDTPPLPRRKCPTCWQQLRKELEC